MEPAGASRCLEPARASEMATIFATLNIGLQEQEACGKNGDKKLKMEASFHRALGELTHLGEFHIQRIARKCSFHGEVRFAARLYELWKELTQINSVRYQARMEDLKARMKTRAATRRQVSRSSA